ncbi:J domain-containing protein [Paenibacillus sp. 1P07SE]|uniref:J domain-containing protein n=1 Tax=Paenibacillus sp. 1P07SE TaxID=3132209 RepID=UPI0039A5ECA1
MDLKQAYTTLGLNEGADKEAVEKRYTILMRQSRTQQRREEAGETVVDKVDLDVVNQAYKLILAHENQKDLDAFNADKYGRYKGMADTAEKADHFFSYYRWHLIIGVVIIIGIIYGINGYMDRQEEKRLEALRPPIDLTFMLYGNYFLEDGGQDIVPLEEAMLAYFPEWQRVRGVLTYLPGEQGSPQDAALVQKAMIMLMTEKSDVYLIDEHNFELLTRQGLLRPLDDQVAGPLAPYVTEDMLRTGFTEDDPEERVYGIRLGETELMQELPLYYQNMVAGVRAPHLDTEQPEHALLFLERFLSGEVPEAPPAPPADAADGEETGDGGSVQEEAA